MKGARFIHFIFSLCLAGLQLNAQSDDALNALIQCGGEADASCSEQLGLVIDNYDAIPTDDERFDAFNKAATTLIQAGRFELALVFADIIEKRFPQDPDRVARAKATTSTAYLYMGNLDSALFYVYEARQIYQDQNDSLGWGTAMVNTGQVLKEVGDYVEALNQYLKAIEVFKALGSERMVARTQTEIAVVYAASGNVDLAIAYNKQAAGFFESRDEHLFAYITLNLANDLIYSSKEDTALILLKRAIPIFTKDKDLYLLMNAEAQYGRALHRLGKDMEAIEHFEKSIELDSNQNFIFQLAYNQEFLGRIYRKLGQNEKALDCAKKSYKYHKILGLNEEYQSALFDLAATYELIGPADSALKYFKEAKYIEDTLFSINKEQQLDELKTKYESDLKEEQIKAGKTEIALLEQKNRAQLNQSIALALGLVLLLLIAIWVITRQKTKISYNRRMAAERDRYLTSELTVKTLEEKRLKSELEHKKRELNSQALLMAEKNEMMHSFKENLQEISERTEESTSINQLVRKIERIENKTEDWDKFMHIFEQVHPDFLKKTKTEFDGLTANDFRLLALMRMNFSNKEIASILHISEGGIKKARYRLRKKLNLASEENMYDFILKL